MGIKTSSRGMLSHSRADSCILRPKTGTSQSENTWTDETEGPRRTYDWPRSAAYRSHPQPDGEHAS
eukprot:8639759-Pyramimonas_sp.AAC.1